MGISIDALKEKKIGLALGGGAVLGAAHIGVLKALEEHDLQISSISGTSIGALVAALYAFGKSCKEMEDIAKDLGWLDIARISLSRFGILSNKNLEELLINGIGDVTFEESKLSLAIIATNISDGQKVVLREGNVAQAVMASSCIPGIFQPIEIEGQLLVDGGIVENVPLSPHADLGADFTIGIDLNAAHSYSRPEHIIDVLVNSFHFTLLNAAKMQTASADLLVMPDLTPFSRTKMEGISELIEAGYEATMRSLE